MFFCFFFSSRRRHTRWPRDWSSDVCSSDLQEVEAGAGDLRAAAHVDRAQALGDLQVVLDGVLEGGDLADGLTDGEVLLEPLGSALGQVGDREIGRASCRERVERWEAGVRRE